MKESGIKTLVAALLLSLVAACGGPPLPADKRDYAGDWRANGMRLLIAANGSVSYERVRTGEHTTINAPIQRFEGASFFVGLGPVTTRFEAAAPGRQRLEDDCRRRGAHARRSRRRGRQKRLI